MFEVVGTMSVMQLVEGGGRAGAHTCSFWVNSRPDWVSRALWHRIPEALEAIATCLGPLVNTSDLYKVDQDTSNVSLHVKWATSEPPIFSVSWLGTLVFCNTNSHPAVCL